MGHKSRLIEEPSKFNPKNLKRAVKYLLSKENNKSLKGRRDEKCGTDYLTEAKIDCQVELRCRQLSSVLHELRKSIMRQDWNEGPTLLMILCHPGLTLHSSLIMKACLLLVLHHPNSHFGLIEDFVRCITGYTVEDEINKFIKILCTFKMSESVVHRKGCKI